MPSPRPVPDPALRLLRRKIRFGTEPDNPTLFPLWRMQEEAVLIGTADTEARRGVFEGQFRLLLDTVMDELVPRHWRCQCLDHIHTPLGSLHRLADDDASRRHVRQLLWELSVSSRYVQHSLIG